MTSGASLPAVVQRASDGRTREPAGTRDEAARPDAAGEKTVGAQGVVGGRDGGAADLERDRELALGRQPGLDGDAAVEDERRDAVTEGGVDGTGQRTQLREERRERPATKAGDRSHLPIMACAWRDWHAIE